MINLLCYEPAGQTLNFSSEDLRRHVLALGATGCGKTTAVVNPFLKQIIGWNSVDKKAKPGLLVLDPKADDSPEKVMAYAREAGRLEDVLVLSAGADSHYGYFTNFRRLDQVDEFATRVLYGSRDMGDQNAYWSESRFGLVSSALTVLLANGRPLSFDVVAEFLRAWFYAPGGAVVNEALQFVERLLAANTLKRTTRRRLELAVAEAHNWKALDPRTQELHKSTLNNALRSLLSPAARELFDESKARRFNPADVLSGKILVASLNAVCHPQLTAMLFKALKREYYEAVLSRTTFHPEHERLCGLVLDELPLSVIPEDTEGLALLRSKGGFVVACSQGLNGLDEALGHRRRAALMANFNSILYFSSRENQTDEHALLTLGSHDLPPRITEGQEPRNLLTVPEIQPVPRFVCPPGTLARLPQHHAYAKLANGTVTKQPVWLAPTFHDAIPARIEEKSDDLAEAANSLRAFDEEAARFNPNVSLFLLHMHRQGHRLKLTPAVVMAAWQLCQPRRRNFRALALLSRQIHGVDLLPPCWLAGLRQWLRKNNKLAPAILSVAIKSGVLWPELDPAFKAWGNGPLAIPEEINLFIYPSLWRPLLPRHLKHLKVNRPDLRPELERPQVTTQGSPF